MSLPTSSHPFLITGNDANQYKIPYSLRFRSGNSAYLSRTPASVSSRTTWTLSFWAKRGLLGNTSTMFGAGNSATGGGPGFAIGFNTSNQFRFSAGGGVTFNYNSTALFRDTSSWYHFVVVWDSTNATTNNRIRVWYNNTEITSWAVQGTPTQNTTIDWNNTTTNYVGAENDAGTIVKFDGYMTEIYSIDGQILSPSSFGQTDSITGIWGPKKYTGTYGTNGFYLPFNDPTSTTTIGYDRQLGLTDSSKNNWTSSGISVTSGVTYDSMIDSPTNYNDGGNNRGNYCTWNPAENQSSLSYLNPTLSDGNMKMTATGSNQVYAKGSIYFSSGKYYVEFTCTGIGVTSATYVSINSVISYYQADGTIGGITPSGSGATYTTNDVIGAAFDTNSLAVSFYKNGVLQVSATATSSALQYYVWVSAHSSSGSWAINCGQRPFVYTPPAGYLALNSYNLANPSLPLV